MPRPNPNRQNAQTQAGAAALTRLEINELVEVCLAAPMDGYPGEFDCVWGLPLLIEGLPGIAKTARVKQLAKALVIKAKSLFSAQHPPEDFSGALIPYGEGQAKQICPLAQVRELIKEGRGILFLDEINGAPPATQGALQSFIHERVVGDEQIPGGIRILAAANPEDIATGGQRLSPPLANRFIHAIDPGPTAREWITWLMGSSKVSAVMQQPLEVIERTIISDWPDLYPETQALFSGFIDRSPSLLLDMPDPGNPQSGKAWPSPRTWDFATRAWTTARILEKSDAIKEALITACVGDGAAATFTAYQRLADIPKPTEVLSGKWQINPDRLDVVLAAYTGAVAYVRQRPTRDEKLKLAAPAWTAISKLFTAGLSDIVVPAVEGLIAERLGRNSGDDTIKQAANTVLVPLSKSGMSQFLEERA